MIKYVSETMVSSWSLLYDEILKMEENAFEKQQREIREISAKNDTNTTKDRVFWKYSEGKILREVETYLSSTYSGHYVGEETKVQTLDLIESIGDAEAFCRSNAIKYLSRFGKKNGKNRMDILKVIHYAMLLYHFTDLPFTEDSLETHSPTGY